MLPISKSPLIDMQRKMRVAGGVYFNMQDVYLKKSSWEGDQDSRAERHGAHLPPTNT